MFRILPFGLSSACYVFTKLLRPLLKRWRSMGIRAVAYLDNGIVSAESEPQCLEHEKIVLSDHEQMLLKASSDRRVGGVYH